MSDDNLRNVLFLENFFKKSKENTLKIRQPMNVEEFDIFGEEEKIAYPKKTSCQKLRVSNNFSGVIQKKYDIVKESTIFRDIDSKKSFHDIKALKQHYNNYLYNSIVRNKTFSNPKFNSSRAENYNYIKKKSIININEQLEIKLKNVSLFILYYHFHIIFLFRMKYKDLFLKKIF